MDPPLFNIRDGPCNLNQQKTEIMINTFFSVILLSKFKSAWLSMNRNLWKTNI